MATYNFGELEALWEVAGGDPANAAIAAAVALAESGGRSDAVSPDGAIGLWQIYPPAHPQWTRQELFDPKTNAEAAVAISRDGTNWQPWDVAWTDGKRGTQGGHYDPYGDSMSGQRYRQNAGTKAAPILGKQPPRLTNPPGGSVGNPEGLKSHLPGAWHNYTHTLGRTLPTQYARAERASRAFHNVVRARPPRKLPGGRSPAA